RDGDDDGRCDGCDGGGAHRYALPGHRYLTSSTTETLPSPCLNSSFTRPRPGANHIVRVPDPNGKPACFSVLVTTTASNVPFGTFTFCTPTTRDVPVTPYTAKSRLFSSDDHVAAGAG